MSNVCNANYLQRFDPFSASKEKLKNVVQPLVCLNLDAAVRFNRKL